LTDPAGLADEVCRIGRAAGLEAVAICDAWPFSGTRQTLRDRAARGLSGGMQFTYRNPDRSTSPELIVPGAASIVVGARRYERRSTRGRSSPPDPTKPTGDDRPPDGGGLESPAPGPLLQGRVAMYAWLDHYGPLRAALGSVADHLKDAGWRARVVVDDNALVDRPAAVRAGLGWYGKNTNVLLPGRGSWFVLGSVVTDAPLTKGIPPPSPVPDGCGSCDRCRSACPTGALSNPGELDARRCLAWLLQAPGSFPSEFRAALADRLYGCDDCQTVCPINRLATRRDPPAEAETGAQPLVDVLDLLSRDDDDLMELVGRWYIPGRAPRYVRRNALVVLGNIGDPSDRAVEAALIRALHDGDPIVRSHAVWAAARLGRRDLLTAVRNDGDPLVEAELAQVAPVGPTPHPSASPL
jgi:epoxyqueuosine reductase